MCLPNHDPDHALLHHVLHIDPRMRQHCLSASIPFPLDHLELTEKLRTVSPRHAHHLVLASGVEGEVRRYIVHFAIEDGPRVVSRFMLQSATATRTAVKM